jgi:DNA (cytosine-5)-methyltransferase 1
MEHPDIAVRWLGDEQPAGQQPQHEHEPRIYVRPLARNGTFWSGADWLICHDGKARRTEPGIPLLVNGFPNRILAWRGLGNAIVPPLAAEVIGALRDILDGAPAQEAI